MQNYKDLKVDLSNCDKEPIHIIGRIQPHGFMAILSIPDLVVEQVSQNIGHYFNATPEQLFGNKLEVICSKEEYTNLEMQLRNSGNINPQLLVIQAKRFFGFIHQSDGRLVVECEPYLQPTELQRFERNFSFSQLQTKLNNHDSIQVQSELIVNYVQSILDYDRVMLYRFDQDWNGEVIAEKVKPGIHSFLYHHFPASDIPAQARVLLEKKHIRQIPDVNASAVDIVPYINPATGSPSNIIESELRNPSEIHLEYLKNMNVKASLSFSIVVKGELWGIVACHHYQPKFVNFWIRQLCNMVAKMYSNAVIASQEKRDLQTFSNYKRKEKLLIEQAENTGSISAGLFRQPQNLLTLMDCTGVAMFLENSLTTVGQTPTDTQLTEIIDWLSGNSPEQVFATRQLSKHFEEAFTYRHVASGLLALEISKYNKEYILFFKPEIRETRIWAGNPEKPASTEKGLPIHPRKSFNKWEEVVKGKSEPWSLNELEIGQLLLKDVVALILKNHAEKLNALNNELHLSAEELITKNKRLEDFAHIISHNLRSPMSNIRGLYQLYKAEPDTVIAADVMKKMNIMIGNMSTTIDDLNLILKTANEKQLPTTSVRLADVIQKEMQNLEVVLLSSQAEITTELDAPEVTAPKVYLQSIVHNLLSNALKYRSPDRKPLVQIKSWETDGMFKLLVADNGLGMNLKKMKYKIFGLYNTFHRNKDAKGLGLYLTKLQIESLGGTIAVESEPDKGTTFTVTLPSAEN